MTTLQKIEKAVECLSPNDLREFCDWFNAFEGSKWDRQMENDVASGGLDLLAKEALGEYKTGKSSKL